MEKNLDLVVELNVHGNKRYETVVLERIAKYERICQELMMTQGNDSAAAK